MSVSVIGKTGATGGGARIDLPDAVHECCAALGVEPMRLCDCELLVLAGWIVPSIDGLEHAFRPRVTESLRDAVVRQRGEAAADALDRFFGWSRANGSSWRVQMREGVTG
ncbi:MAG: hypothetical protein FWG50_05825 [Kiritimatiellaeota bacterium]|nr:hypothetical protein [Kiritimatiellota bacterium]